MNNQRNRVALLGRMHHHILPVFTGQRAFRPPESQQRNQRGDIRSVNEISGIVEYVNIDANGPDEFAGEDAERFGVDGAALAEAAVHDTAELDGGVGGAAGLEGGVGHGRELGEDGEGALVGAVSVGADELGGDEGDDVGLAQMDLRGAVLLGELDGELAVVGGATAVDSEVGKESGFYEFVVVERHSPCICQPLLHLLCLCFPMLEV